LKHELLNFDQTIATPRQLYLYDTSKSWICL